MPLQTIGAFFPANALKHVAYQAELDGATKYQVVRYLAYRAAGMPHDNAVNLVMPRRNLSEFPGEIRRTQTQVDTEIIEKIRARYPGKDLSWALRFQAAMLRDGADENFAVEIADGIRRGPRTRKNQSAIETAIA